jgi:hypothetical protein
LSFRPAAVRAPHLNLILLFASAAAWPAAAPTAADLARCAAMTAPDARLACYDSLSAPPANGAAAAGAATKAPAVTPAAPATPAVSAPAAPAAAPTGVAPVTSAGSAPSAVAAPAAAPAAPAASASSSKSSSPAAPADDPQNFGFTPAQVQAHSQAPPPQGLQSIQAHVANVFTDRMKNAFVLLDNGQMWAYEGDDGRLRPGDPITIKRASLGSFIMLTQSRRSYHVTRTR